MKDNLGVPLVKAQDELRVYNSSAVRLVWLRDQFAYKSVGLSDDHIDCAVRAYLLFLLGCTLFSDKTGITVPVAYLNFLIDISDISSYGWGAGALAQLYRQLGIASRAKAKQICGYLTLLEVLIVFHII
ncbi:hypothetical protein QJS04_geneDACA023485 [Acorus gramineus]|uniref:Aminotransferase-like plant mobile domain-containing protein n=1 Tax=Acorus gramineus TaxID=55184 RepID=A0AAV9B7R7_ACOGR|nr:hypothetical protein QJS04_geneDACA023485 [Acorus gramineus]